MGTHLRGTEVVVAFDLDAIFVYFVELSIDEIRLAVTSGREKREQKNSSDFPAHFIGAGSKDRGKKQKKLNETEDKSFSPGHPFARESQTSLRRL